MDDDCNGFVTKKELRDAMVTVSEKICEQYIAEFDVNNDGELEFYEFASIFLPAGK